MQASSCGRVIVAEPPRGLGIVDLRELWAYRELLRTLAVRQIRLRYKQTLLGTTWAWFSRSRRRSSSA